jgi:hypothetical protein
MALDERWDGWERGDSNLVVAAVHIQLSYRSLYRAHKFTDKVYVHGRSHERTLLNRFVRPALVPTLQLGCAICGPFPVIFPIRHGLRNGKLPPQNLHNPWHQPDEIIPFFSIMSQTYLQ